MKRKFLFKTFFFIFLSSLFSILLLTLVIYQKMKEDNYQIAYNEAQNIQSEFGTRLHSLLAEYERDAKIWVQKKSFIELLEKPETGVTDEVYNSLYFSLAQRRYRADVTVLTLDHVIAASTNTDIAEQYTWTSVEWGIFREIQQSTHESGVVTYVPQSTLNHSIDTALSLGVPVHHDANLIGYIIIDFPHTTLSEIYRSSSISYNIDLILSDANFFSFFDSRNVFQNNVFLPESMQTNFQKNASGTQEKHDERELFLKQWIPDYDLQIFAVVPFEPFQNLASKILQSLWVIIILLLIFSIIFSYFLALSLYRPIDIIIKNMGRVERGDLHATFQVSSNNEMSAIANQFDNMMKNIRSLVKENEEKQIALRAAEIKALQSQMRPHFLYNVLNSIKFMAKLNHVDSIAEMVTSLATLLRSNIATEKEVESVTESISLIESYLKIQSYRYEENLEYEIHVDDDARHCIIPRLIIQPLVENAIEHGIEEINGKGKIFLSLTLHDGYIFITVEDNGIGIDSNFFEFLNSDNNIQKPHTKGNGIGLKNIYERLSYYYGKDFRMTILNTGGTSVMIKIPCKEIDK